MTSGARQQQFIKHESGSISQSSHTFHGPKGDRLNHLKIEIERFLKDKELLTQLEANDLTRSGRACEMLKDDIKSRSETVKAYIVELRELKS